MTTLNAEASRGAIASGARCATDVTGFGLLGHASHVARASQVTLRIASTAVPLLPGVAEAWIAGAKTGGAERNASYLASLVQWGSVPEATRAILVDPQTSGGLLIAVAASSLRGLLARLPDAAEIGEVEPQGEAPIIVD